MRFCFLLERKTWICTGGLVADREEARLQVSEASLRRHRRFSLRNALWSRIREAPERSLLLRSIEFEAQDGSYFSARRQSWASVLQFWLRIAQMKLLLYD